MIWRWLSVLLIAALALLGVGMVFGAHAANGVVCGAIILTVAFLWWFAAFGD